MLNLIHPADPGTVLPAVADLLAEAQPRGVRHAHVRPPESLGTAPAGATGDLRDPADVLAIRQILLHARNGLINCPKVRDSQPKFPLFSLVVLLMNRSRKSRDLNLESALLRDLQELGLYRRFRNFTNAVKKELPDDRTTWKLSIYLNQALTWGLFRAAVTGRVPLLSGRYRHRHLQRQPARRRAERVRGAGFPDLGDGVHAERLHRRRAGAPDRARPVGRQRARGRPGHLLAGRVRVLRRPRGAGLRRLPGRREPVRQPGGVPRRRRRQPLRGEFHAAPRVSRSVLLLHVTRFGADRRAAGTGTGLLRGSGQPVPVRAVPAGPFAGRARGAVLRRSTCGRARWCCR